jgi:hypothetical protein
VGVDHRRGTNDAGAQDRRCRLEQDRSRRGSTRTCRRSLEHTTTCICSIGATSSSTRTPSGWRVTASIRLPRVRRPWPYSKRTSCVAPADQQPKSSRSLSSRESPPCRMTSRSQCLTGAELLEYVL